MPEKTILKMHISSDEHSHLIGKSGKHHKELQQLTKSRIHFPDMNIVSSRLPILNCQIGDSQQRGSEKSNEVLITAELPNLLEHIEVTENARKLLRHREQFLIHIMIPESVDLSDYYVLQRFFDQISQQITNKNVCVFAAKDLSRVWIVKGTTACADQVIIVTNLIVKKLQEDRNIQQIRIYSTIEISKHHQKDVCLFGTKEMFKEFNHVPVGSQDSLVKLFLRELRVELRFSDSNSTVLILGKDPAEIFHAKQRLISYWPVALSFEVLMGSVKITPQDIMSLENLYSVKLKKIMPSKRANYIQISLESFEKNLPMVYQLYTAFVNVSITLGPQIAEPTILDSGNNIFSSTSTLYQPPPMSSSVLCPGGRYTPSSNCLMWPDLVPYMNLGGPAGCGWYPLFNPFLSPSMNLNMSAAAATVSSGPNSVVAPQLTEDFRLQYPTNNNKMSNDNSDFFHTYSHSTSTPNVKKTPPVPIMGRRTMDPPEIKQEPIYSFMGYPQDDSKLVKPVPILPPGSWSSSGTTGSLFEGSRSSSSELSGSEMKNSPSPPAILPKPIGYMDIFNIKSIC